MLDVRRNIKIITLPLRLLYESATQRSRVRFLAERNIWMVYICFSRNLWLPMCVFMALEKRGFPSTEVCVKITQLK